MNQRDVESVVIGFAFGTVTQLVGAAAIREMMLKARAFDFLHDDIKGPLLERAQREIDALRTKRGKS